jgi:type 1 glutamine amidotransferase
MVKSLKLIQTFAALCLLTLPSHAAEPIRALIFSGQNNHDWKATTPVLQKILTRTGRFTVDVTDRPDQCTAETFAKYDVVLSNWNAFGKGAVTNWPAGMRTAFLDFARSGKGFVVVHAGSSSFYDWLEYQQLAGAWWNLAKTHHDAPHQFTVKLTGDHPVTRGLEPFSTTDELWKTPGIDPSATVLATGDDQPVALATGFGRGRGFTLLIGHEAKFMANEGFQTLLVRDTEWAATSQVSPSGNSQPLNRITAQ